MAEDNAERKGATPQRIAISKKLRFEVFKRDSFACVYCGASAPTVVLHVDHLKPVASGGDNDIMNLVTACFDCNAGKGARELSDQSALAKQRANLEDLNERRVQLEMLLEWRESLADLEDTRVKAVTDAIAAASAGERLVSEQGKLHVKRWLKKFSLAEVLDAVDASFASNLELGASDDVFVASWGKAFRAVPKIAGIKRASIDKPYLQDALYVRGILRRRSENGDLDEYYYGDALELIEKAFRHGATAESLKACAKTATVWDNFVQMIEKFCAEHPERSAPPPAPPEVEEHAADAEVSRPAIRTTSEDERRVFLRRLEQLRNAQSDDVYDFPELERDD